MELNTFKYYMKSKYGINVRNVVVNTTRDDKELIWSEIKWKEVPALVKLSGARRSDTVIKFVARVETGRRDRNVYVTMLKVIIPISRDSFQHLAAQYAYGYVTRMPVRCGWYGYESSFGVAGNQLGCIKDHQDALVSAVRDGGMNEAMKMLLRSIHLWNTITGAPDVKIAREKILAARAEAKKWNDLARKALNNCREVCYDDGFQAFRDITIEQAEKKVALAIEGNPNYLKGKGVKAIR